MKALVTGAAGFVGSHLVAHLLAEGDSVVGTDRTSGGPDLLDPDRLVDLLADVRPDVVFHLAGQADVARSWTDPTSTIRTNTEGTHHLLGAARTAKVRRVVTVTSADVYGIVGPDDLPLTEDAPFRPVSPYAASKAMADILAQQHDTSFRQRFEETAITVHQGYPPFESTITLSMDGEPGNQEIESVVRIIEGAASRDWGVIDHLMN